MSTDKESSFFWEQGSAEGEKITGFYQPEPQTTPAPASDEGPDKQQGRKKKEPDQLTTYDPAGSIPFSEWDGEEGPRP